MNWASILKTDWKFTIDPKNRNRGEYKRNLDEVTINLPKNLPIGAKKYNRETGKSEVDYDYPDLDEKSLQRILNVVVHEAGHAGMDKFLEEEGFPENDKMTFIDEFLNKAKFFVWAEILAETNEHQGDIERGIEVAKELRTYNRYYGRKATPFQQKLQRIWNHTTDEIIDNFEKKVKEKKGQGFI
tara:strand:- start:855 stop:1409 length:555 start_codon:yes stop_codon:yes gene_type:complete